MKKGKKKQRISVNSGDASGCKERTFDWRHDVAAGAALRLGAARSLAKDGHRDYRLETGFVQEAHERRKRASLVAPKFIALAVNL